MLDQLKSSGSIAYSHLMSVGYPTHIEIESLYQILKPYDFILNNAKAVCKSFLHSIGFKESDFKFGSSKLFLRPGKDDVMSRFLKSGPSDFELTIKNMKAFIIKSRWKVLLFTILFCCKGSLSFEIKIQSSSEIKCIIYIVFCS